MSYIEALYVPELEPSLKHPAVFKKFDELKAGEGFLLVNDHDPIPLFYELQAERGNVFDWQKLEDGPESWKVLITKTVESYKGAAATQDVSVDTNNSRFVLNVTLLEPRLKHPTIFSYFDNLQPGEAFQILNDHDPKPLYYQMLAERGNVFTWQYIEKGPQQWVVEIKKNEAGVTIGEIVAKDIRKAEVFKKYGIDFCCGGKKTLQQACEKAQVDVAIVEAALAQADTIKSATPAFDFARWDADFLADYIYNQHHIYYYQEGPVIKELAEKVAARHGEHFPHLYALLALFTKLQAELSEHFLKEETVLFPFVKGLMTAKRTKQAKDLYQYLSISEPVQLMEEEHDAAGQLLVEIRNVTNDFNPPQGSCNSFRLLYSKLEDLETDLHQHVHLENNILFPKALALEKELTN
jgi:regulator of cell morphogenesis and NO signaling